MFPHPRKLWRFPGGLRLAHHTEQSVALPLLTLPPPARVLLPLNHNGLPLTPMAEMGQAVDKGQIIARGEPDTALLHATISGSVAGIIAAPLAHPSGLAGPCLLIESDGNDHWVQPGPY